MLNWLNYSLETTAAANAQVVQSHKRHQRSFAQLTFQSVDLTKTTTATTYTEKNGMKQSGFVGTVGNFMELRKTAFTFTTTNMYQ